MKSIVSFLALVLGATAAAIRRGDTCLFELTASGGVSGVVGQLPDGQNRVGGSYPTGEYSLSNGGITDNQARGCILTPPTTQLQCDVGATATTGFSIDCYGSVTHNGSPTFYACPATDSEYNIYSSPAPDQSKCVQITLTASGCFSACPSSTASVAPSSTCPADLPSDFQFPHLIVPVTQSKPDQEASQSSLNGVINSDTSSIFNFDIPSSYDGKQCKLEFLFPQQSQLQTSSYAFSGDGVLDFVELSTVASLATTFNTAGSGKDQGQFVIKPGTATTIVVADCPAGQAVSFEVKAVSGTSLTYFQDYNPCPIGLYVVPV